MPDEETSTLLIGMGILTNKVDMMSKIMNDMKDCNVKEHDAIFKRVRSVTDKKISNRLFFWLMGIMIAAQIMLAGTVGVISKDVATNTGDISHIEMKLNRVHK